MALTSAQRAALPASDFAIPGKRLLPVYDKEHVKMAWNVIGETKGLSDADLYDGRLRIMAKAVELGMETTDWKIPEISMMSAMSLNIPETLDHPNKAPFSGILVRLDQASDMAPHGSMGMKTFLTSAAAEAALGSLLGMAINCTVDLKGHDVKAKIGIIDSATIESDALGKYVKIGGFIYASDFPETYAAVKAEKDKLGFSFEARHLYVSDHELPNTLEINKLTFTGAAILYKKTAAYQSTSLAAAAEEIKMDEELKNILAGITAGITGLGDRLKKVEEGADVSIQAGAVITTVRPFSTGLRDIAGKMAAANIGTAPIVGHVAIINAMADAMDLEASRGVLASAYVLPVAAAAAAAPAESAEIKALKDSIASLTTMVADVKAAAEKSPNGAPQRQTVSPVIAQLMARAGVTLEGDKKMTVTALDAVLANSKLEPTKRMELKIGMRNAGLLES
jgi:hypothetical protein